jgi:hypothetical protein
MRMCAKGIELASTNFNIINIRSPDPIFYMLFCNIGVEAGDIKQT